MTAERYVALGLARARTPWFTDVARWATMAAVPVDYLKCLSIEEARARLTAGRPYSALLVDGTLPDLDRDLIDQAQRVGCAVLVVDDERVRRDWLALGAAAVLPEGFDRADLVAALDEHALAVTDAARRPGPVEVSSPSGWRGAFVAVTGGGGVGTSTVAMALAQGLAADARYQGTALLADFALTADLALLHDARDVMPGLPEVVEAHRVGSPPPAELRSLTFDVVERGYHLLLGLRRHRDWATLRPRALDAALDAVRRSYRILVADTDADVEGEAECGSVDVEERNLLARTTLAQADVVVVVGLPGLHGTHRQVRVLSELLAFGVPCRRVLPVVNRAPRSPRHRADLAAALPPLLGPAGDDPAELASPVFLPDRRRLEEALHDGVRLPSQLADPLASAVTAVLEREGARHRISAIEPEPITAGSLGSWSPEAEAR